MFVGSLYEFFFCLFFLTILLYFQQLKMSTISFNNYLKSSAFQYLR